MTRYISLAALIAFSLLLCGCPYESSVPIDTPSMKIDAKLLGKWQNEKDKKETWSIAKKDEHTYYIEGKSDKSEGDKYEAYLSSINGVVFLNLYELKDGDPSRKYVFYKIESLTNDKVVLATPSENITEQFTTSAELKKFFAANIKNSYFFEKERFSVVRMGK